MRPPLSPKLSNLHETSQTGAVCEQLVAPNEWEGEAEEEINIEDEERSEEVEPARVAPDPGQPTAKQVADHNVIHYAYQTGRGANFALWAVGR